MIFVSQALLDAVNQNTPQDLLTIRFYVLFYSSKIDKKLLSNIQMMAIHLDLGRT